MQGISWAKDYSKKFLSLLCLGVLLECNDDFALLFCFKTFLQEHLLRLTKQMSSLPPKALSNENLEQ